MRPRTRRTYLAVGGIAAAVTAVGPHSVATACFLAALVSAAVALLAGLHVFRPEKTAVWWLILTVFVTWAIADSAGLLAGATATPRFDRIAYATAPGYLLMIVAAVVLMRAYGRVPLANADASVGLLALVAMTWSVGLEPNLRHVADPSHAGAVAIVLVDLVVNVLLLRVAFSAAGGHRAFQYLYGGIALMTVGDVVNVSPDMSGRLPERIVLTTYVLSAVFAGAAGLHPSMRVLPARTARDAEPRAVRTTTVLAASLFAPLVGLVVNEYVEQESDTWVFAVIGLVIVTIVAHRIGQLMHRSEELRAAAEASEQKFRMVFDSAGIGISLGSGGMLTETNGAYQRMLGYSPEELKEMHYSEVTHPDDRDIDEDAAREVAAGRRSSSVVEKRCVRKDGSELWVRVTVTMASDGTFGIGVVEDITERRRLEAERARLLARTAEAAEAERMALAADLHDGPIQHLTAVTLTLDLLVNKLSRGEATGAAALAQQLRESVATEMRSLRQLMTELRPPILDERGLDAALMECADAALAGSAVTFDLASTLDGHRLAPEIETVVYRVVREALTNVRKHAEARTVHVVLDVQSEVVVLTVADDGVGFVPATVNGDHVGVLMMRERVEGVGGTWRLDAAPGEGTRIRVTVPRKLRALGRKAA